MSAKNWADRKLKDGTRVDPAMEGLLKDVWQQEDDDDAGILDKPENAKRVFGPKGPFGSLSNSKSTSKSEAASSATSEGGGGDDRPRDEKGRFASK